MSRTRSVAEIGLLALLYFLTARLGQLMAIPPGKITPVWIPSGIILAAVLLRGYRVWPGIFLGAFAGNVWAYFSAGSAGALLRCLLAGTANGLGDTLGTVAGAYLITRTTGGRDPLGRLGDMAKLLAYGGILGAGVSALFGVTALSLAGFVPWHNYGFSLVTWWTGDAVGVLVIAPLLLAWRRGWRDCHFGKEELLFCLLLSALSPFTFRLFPDVPGFSIIPLLLWAVLRFDRRVLVVAIVAAAAIVNTMTVLGLGPFAAGSMVGSMSEMLNLQLFLALITVPMLMLAGALADSAQVQRNLAEFNHDLENRVQERTKQLDQTRLAALSLMEEAVESHKKTRLVNIDLKKEIAQRQVADMALLATQENLVTLINALPDNVIFKDGNGRWLVANPPAIEFFQLKNIPWIGKTDAELAGAIPVLKDLFAACTRSDQIGWAAHELTRVTEHGPGLDGRMEDHEVCKVPLFNPDGSRHALLVIGRDVTAKRRLESALKLSELMASQSRDSLLLIRRSDGRIFSANAAAVMFYGYPREELLTKTIYDLRQDNTPAEITRVMKEAFNGGILFENVHIRKDGHTMPVEVSAHGITYEGEEFLISVIRDIGIRKKTEEKMLQLEQSMDAAANGIFLVSPAGKIFWANAAFTGMTGYPAAEVMGKNPRYLKSGQHDAGFYRRLWETILAGKVWHGEIINRRKDGTLYTENKTITPVLDAAGKISHFICVQEDITARKKVETALIESEQKFRTLAEAVPQIIWVTTPAGANIYYNQQWVDYTGLTREECYGENWVKPFHPGDRQRALEAWQIATATHETYQLECRLRRADGVYHWWLIRGEPKWDQNGNIIQWFGTCTDIDNLKQAETRLAQLNDELEQRVLERTHEIKLLSEVINQSTVAFSMSNPDGSFITINEAYARLTGYSRAEILDKKLKWSEDLTPPEWRPIGDQKLKECLRTRQTVQFEKEYLRKNGSRVPVEVFVQPVFGPDDKLLNLRAFITDITERKELARKLASDAHEIEELYNRAPCGYHSLNNQGEFVRVNDTELGWLGYTRAELLGRNLADILTPECRELFEQIFTGFTNADTKGSFDMEIVGKDGMIIPVVMNSVAVRDAAGNFVQSRMTVFDNTERKKAAAELERAWLGANAASRAKSEFLANMSHEIRTPLNAILGFTHLLRQDASLPEPALNKLQIIGQSGDHLLTILNDILDLAKIESGRMGVLPVEFSFAGLLEDVLHLFRAPAEAKRLSLKLVKAGELPPLVRGDGEKIRRVISNLVGNAVKFTQTGGIEVTAKTIGGGAGQPLRMHIAVKDTGLGIAPEEIGRLFKKFEQTNSGRVSQTGTGLGLAISQEYARLLGGGITVQSEFGQGSTFEFEVPVEVVWDPEPIRCRVKGLTQQLVPCMPECRVLVVDDLEDNRIFLKELLELAGFACRMAASGAEALVLASAWRPQLVLMDTRMPETDGLETIRRLRAEPENAALKIISLTATAYAEDRAAARAAGADDFLAKPVPPAELLDTIAGLLGVNLVLSAPAAPASIPAQAETVAALARLPQSWRDPLRDNLQTANFHQVEEAIKTIKSEHPDLARSLRQLTGQFDAESLLQLLADAAALASNHHE